MTLHFFGGPHQGQSIEIKGTRFLREYHFPVASDVDFNSTIPDGALLIKCRVDVYKYINKDGKDIFFNYEGRF